MAQTPETPANTPDTPQANRTEDPHLEMMGDETEEQNLNQEGHPEKRIEQDEVEAAFGRKDKPADGRH